MSFLGGNRLQQILEQSLGDQFNEEKIKQISYELSLGGEVFLTDSDNGKPEVLDDQNQYIEINPGQFALLLTDESISMPNDKLGLISIKAGEKLKGLVNVSGFHVDPGFNGQLLFSVYNAGPSKITLKKGKSYFLIWFSEILGDLDENEVYNVNENNHQNQQGIPTKYIDALKRGNLASPNVLLEKIKTIKNSLKIYWWLLGIILAISIATCTWLYKQKSSYESGFKDGYSKKEIEEKVNKKIDFIINEKMDSVLHMKMKKIKLDTIN